MSTATTPAVVRRPDFRAASPLLFDVAVPAATSSTSLTGSRSPSATPTARAPTPFHQFGIVRDDYSPKPVFERLRQILPSSDEAPGTCGKRDG